MPQRKFANQKALIDYAEQNGLVYVWAWIERQRVISPAFTKRKRRSVRDCGCAHISWCADGNAVSKGDPASGVCGQRSVTRGPGDPTRALAGEAGGEAKDNMKNGAASGGGSVTCAWRVKRSKKRSSLGVKALNQLSISASVHVQS